MATQHLSSALRTPASLSVCPMANPGYGKRSAPEQLPLHSDTFALLPVRERSIAGFIDRLPEGAAMSVKQLAKQLPLYGQQAVSTSLKALSVAGHLRRVRCSVVGAGDETRWVFRTFWSRTARDNAWWNAYLADEKTARAAPDLATSATLAPDNGIDTEVDVGINPDTVGSHRGAVERPSPVADRGCEAPPSAASPVHAPAPDAVHAPAPSAGAVPVHTPAGAPAHSPAPSSVSVHRERALDAGPRDRVTAAPVTDSPAYLALAQLGRRDHRLTLSADDCAALAPQAAEWLDRGVNTDYLVAALTAGLPAHVDCPSRFVRRRLTDKIPPRLPTTPNTAPSAPAPARRILMECTGCGRPGRPEALPDGLCRPCHTTLSTNHRSPAEPSEIADVRAHMANLRDLLRAP
ncbi:MarR family transcriptional regulator [Streptomyces sp. NPDC101181]|uniref:MarR family transcriptional regulator n=1 Tax=Streptomyces sp. NPDC101181 TaxID=3366125 RepID=UPI00382622F7